MTEKTNKNILLKLASLVACAAFTVTTIAWSVPSFAITAQSLGSSFRKMNNDLWRASGASLGEKFVLSPDVKQWLYAFPALKTKYEEGLASLETKGILSGREARDLRVILEELFEIRKDIDWQDERSLKRAQVLVRRFQKKAGASSITKNMSPKAASLGSGIILGDDLTAIKFKRNNKEVTFATEAFDSLFSMVKLSRKLRVELEAECFVGEDGVVRYVHCPNDETKIAVVKTSLNPGVYMNNSEFYMGVWFLIGGLKRIVRNHKNPEDAKARKKKSGIVFRRSRPRYILRSGAETTDMKEHFLDSLGRLGDHFTRMRSWMEMYSQETASRIRIDQKFLRKIMSECSEKTLDEIIESPFMRDIMNIETLATEWWSTVDFGGGTGFDEVEGEIIKIHNHPIGYPSPPSAILTADGPTGDIYCGGFMEGEVSGLILDTRAGEELLLFYEPDSSNERKYRELFSRFWGGREREGILPDLRNLAMQPEFSVDTTEASSLGAEEERAEWLHANLPEMLKFNERGGKAVVACSVFAVKGTINITVVMRVDESSKTKNFNNFSGEKDVKKVLEEMIADPDIRQMQSRIRLRGLETQLRILEQKIGKWNTEDAASGSSLGENQDEGSRKPHKKRFRKDSGKSYRENIITGLITFGMYAFIGVTILLTISMEAALLPFTLGAAAVLYCVKTIIEVAARYRGWSDERALKKTIKRHRELFIRFLETAEVLKDLYGGPSYIYFLAVGGGEMDFPTLGQFIREIKTNPDYVVKPVNQQRNTRDRFHREVSGETAGFEKMLSERKETFELSKANKKNLTLYLAQIEVLESAVAEIQEILKVSHTSRRFGVVEESDRKNTASSLGIQPKTDKSMRLNSRPALTWLEKGEALQLKRSLEAALGQSYARRVFYYDELHPFIFVMLEDGFTEGDAMLETYKSFPETLRRKMGDEKYTKLSGNIIFANNSLYSDWHYRYPVSVHALIAVKYMLKHKDSFRGATVADFGSGDGLLSRVALRMGAKEVVLIEKERSSSELARLHLEKDGWIEGRDFLIVENDILEDDFRDGPLHEVLSEKTAVVLANIGPWKGIWGDANSAAVNIVSRWSNVSLFINSGYDIEPGIGFGKYRIFANRGPHARALKGTGETLKSNGFITSAARFDGARGIVAVKGKSQQASSLGQDFGLNEWTNYAWQIDSVEGNQIIGAEHLINAFKGRPALLNRFKGGAEFKIGSQDFTCIQQLGGENTALIERKTDGARFVIQIFNNPNNPLRPSIKKIAEMRPRSHIPIKILTDSADRWYVVTPFVNTEGVKREGIEYRVKGAGENDPRNNTRELLYVFFHLMDAVDVLHDAGLWLGHWQAYGNNVLMSRNLLPYLNDFKHCRKFTEPVLGDRPADSWQDLLRIFEFAENYLMRREDLPEKAALADILQKYKLLKGRWLNRHFGILPFRPTLALLTVYEHLRRFIYARLLETDIPNEHLVRFDGFGLQEYLDRGPSSQQLHRHFISNNDAFRELYPEDSSELLTGASLGEITGINFTVKSKGNFNFIKMDELENDDLREEGMTRCTKEIALRQAQTFGAALGEQLTKLEKQKIEEDRILAALTLIKESGLNGDQLLRSARKFVANFVSNKLGLDSRMYSHISVLADGEEALPEHHIIAAVRAVNQLGRLEILYEGEIPEFADELQFLGSRLGILKNYFQPLSYDGRSKKSDEILNLRSDIPGGYGFISPDGELLSEISESKAQDCSLIKYRAVNEAEFLTVAVVLLTAYLAANPEISAELLKQELPEIGIVWNEEGGYFEVLADFARAIIEDYKSARSLGRAA